MNKTALKIFLSFIFLAAATAIIMLLINCVGLALLLSDKNDIYSNSQRYILDQISQNMTVSEDGLMLSDRSVLPEENWAMVIDAEGDVIWELNRPDDVPVSYSINDKTLYMPGRCGIIEFPDHATNVQFHVTSTINGIGDRFSYRLNDLTTEWSNWQNSGIISFTSIPAGSHSLEIKDLFGNLLRFNIVVQYPVYKRWWAIVLYIFLGAGMISFIVWRIERQRKMKLKHNLEKENSRLQNELKEQENQALREKVRSQETEMMTNLKFLTQKQELIDAISAEIDKQKMELGDRWPNKNYNRLLKVIQTGTTETDKLLSFENFFVEIHKNFMDRLKAVHSDLSTGELRLACLIRANLTTKEISAVMGIASRSVEIKRYRLKKKLGLPNEASLTTYINTL